MILDLQQNVANLKTSRLMKSFVAMLAIAFCLTGFAAQTANAQTTSKSTAKKSAFPEWSTVIDGATKIDGLFNLYLNEKKQKLYMEIPKTYYNKELIMPISIARGSGLSYLGGDTLNFGNQWIVSFKRVGNRILMVRKNVGVRAKAGTPVADSLKTSHTDSIILALPIRSEQANGLKVLIDLSDIFMTDIAGIGVRPDKNRSTWGKVKAFEKNVEIQVNTVFSSPYGGMSFLGGGSSSPDPRGTQIVMHYGLSLLPSTSYKPRKADDRVGYFLSSVDDYSKDTGDTPKVRYVTRWRLEKEDSSAKLSAPKKPIIFWIEKSVPREYRRFVREGILEWNKAFEKIGFLEAIQCRDQQSLDDFEPEDIRFNTFRWITTSAGFAMGPSRTNPKTGEILDADIVFDESMIRAYRNMYVRRIGIPQALELQMSGQTRPFYKLHSADIPYMAAMPQIEKKYLQERASFAKKYPHANFTNPTASHIGFGSCNSNCQKCMMGPGMHQQIRLMAAVLVANGTIQPGEKVPEKYIGQAIKEVVMHEVGHTLGLRHNFKSSSIYTLDELRDPEFTKKFGMTASVMDYAPAYFAPKGKKQGDYFSSTIGPYDYWAIEYAYKPISSKEDEELAKIASRAPEKNLTFATDEDLYTNPDPRINLFDLADPLEYAAERIVFAKEAMKGLEDRVVAKGEGWQRAREAFMTLLGEISRSTQLATQYIGGEYTSRDHKGDPDARLPMRPIDFEKQQKALKLINDEIMTAKAFDFSPELLKHMAPEHFSDNSYLFGEPYHLPVNDIILRIQSMPINYMLSSDTLNSIQEIQRHAVGDEKTIQLVDIFNTLTESVWSDMDKKEIKKNKNSIELDVVRRNLQRAHIKSLSNLALGKVRSAPADGKALARSHLRRISNRISEILKAADNDKMKTNEMTHVHLSEIRIQIGKILNAEMGVNSL